MTEVRWLTVEQAAAYLQVHVKTAYSMVASKRLPAAKIAGGKKGIRIDRLELDRRLERQCKGIA